MHHCRSERERKEIQWEMEEREREVRSHRNSEWNVERIRVGERVGKYKSERVWVRERRKGSEEGGRKRLRYMEKRETE
jgi:hypothetical protein